jgi:hypothetical protein
LMTTRSLRRLNDDDMRADSLATQQKSDPERLESVELRYERQHTEHFWLGTSAFYQIAEVVDYNQAIDRNDRLGEYDVYGLELEAIWKDDSTHILLSHAYTKLLDFELNDSRRYRAIVLNLMGSERI